MDWVSRAVLAWRLSNTLGEAPRDWRDFQRIKTSSSGPNAKASRSTRQKAGG